MKMLLDTHVWLWMVLEPERLSEAASDALANAQNETILSVASAWELAIKQALGKLSASGPVDTWVQSSLQDFELAVLPIGLQHALVAAALPPIHKDPFDRMLIAQAQVEGLVLVTADESIRQYGGAVLWAI